MKPQVLIATLGTEPQVVTLALDLLQHKGYAIHKVIIVHTVNAIIQPTLACLREEFARPNTLPCELLPIRGDAGPVADMVTEADVSALVAWQFSEGSPARKMIRPGRPEELLPYLLLVRALRLADQQSQQV